jgi:dipeptidase E
MKRPRQVLALGGGGFSMEPNNPLLDEYLLSLAAVSSPKICFVPTASGDNDNYVVRFFRAFARYNCRATTLSLFRLPTQDLRSYILEMDIVFVGGGNTRSMMALWREWRLDEILTTAWHEGVVLSGISAGSICWYEWGLTDSVPGELLPLKGLGLLKGSGCPHYDGEANRRPTFRRNILSGSIPAGVAADDGVGIHYVDETISSVVSSRKHAKAYSVEVVDGGILERQLDARYLGS